MVLLPLPPNPFDYLGTAAGKVAADAWTAACLGVFNAGMWLLKVALTIVDFFTTPDISEAGPGREIYQTTFWLAVTLMLILTMAQLGISAFRRDGKNFAQVLIGTGQFLMIWVGWIAYGVTVIAACGGLTKALMHRLLHIEKWAQFEPLGTQLSPKDVTDGTIATVLAILGLMMVLAAIGHILVMLTRAGALIILAATTPISAAGLSTEFGRSWFWKSFRWFHAAALTPVLMVLVLGIGVQLTAGAATGLEDGLQSSIGTAIPGVLLILMACFCPLALFKLLAFVDPGTTSGAAMRAGMAAQGGISGLMGGSQSGGTTSAASAGDGQGRSQGESSAEDTTSGRFSGSSGGGFMGKLGALGAVGQAAATGLNFADNLANRATTIGADLSNQMGVGHNQYVPDFSSPRRGGGSSKEDGNPAVNGSGPDADQGQGGSQTPPSPPMPPTPTPPAPSMPSAPTTGGSGGAAAAGGATPPPVV
ncbi:hypothetical protein IGS73_07430 [Janibacter indicus]|uniref:TrbL/VirB6 plasmid conjugal transfer protein n=1 Tax=Janibacter indicus TaxID=857417 RepID=A0A7L9J3I4_9MICO|nr:hypothetical protein [Janibacter indicus]QOK24181.1 hypothetical protein IGS73_07430 [Janibacter indicus]